MVKVLPLNSVFYMIKPCLNTEIEENTIIYIRELYLHIELTDETQGNFCVSESSVMHELVDSPISKVRYISVE